MNSPAESSPHSAVDRNPRISVIQGESTRDGRHPSKLGVDEDSEKLAQHEKNRANDCEILHPSGRGAILFLIGGDRIRSEDGGASKLAWSAKRLEGDLTRDPAKLRREKPSKCPTQRIVRHSFGLGGGTALLSLR